MNFKSTCALIVVVVMAAVAAAAAPPTVSNVVSAQRPNSYIVDITYDVADPDDALVSVSLLLSLDGGASFSVPCLHASGDIGDTVVVGTDRHIAWDARSDVPGLQLAGAVVRVVADDTYPGPVLSWFRLDSGSPVPAAPVDTVGFGRPYSISWPATTAAIAMLAPEAVAALDTVYPYDDGILGYKWRLPGELGDGCVDDLGDCWHPRRFDEASGDSFSYFAPSSSLTFRNDGSGAGPLLRLLASGTYAVEANALDISGREVRDGFGDRSHAFVVNYDPETVVLDGETDWLNPSDPEVYPYYISLNDPTRTHVPFRAGDRIPDRSYVVVKALSRDDARDAALDPDRPVTIAGRLGGRLALRTGGLYEFVTGNSDAERAPSWGPSADGWYADTLGFLVGPATDYTVTLNGIDEHGRRDGTPATLSFTTGYAPCVQCVELLPDSSSPSQYPANMECADDPSTHPCFGSTTELRVTQSGVEPGTLEYTGDAFIAVAKSSGYTQVVTDTLGMTATNYIVIARLYRSKVLLHGLDDVRERWASPLSRVGAWRYQVDFGCDPYNTIAQGGGIDDIMSVTWGGSGTDGPFISTIDGLWRLDVEVAVPTQLITLGPDTYRIILRLVHAGGDADLADFIFRKTTMMTGEGTIRVIALDQASCSFAPLRPATYNLFGAVRPPVATLPPGDTWRDCDLLQPDIKARIPLAYGAMESNGGVPLVKPFRIVVMTSTGDFMCAE